MRILLNNVTDLPGGLLFGEMFGNISKSSQKRDVGLGRVVFFCGLLTCTDSSTDALSVEKDWRG